MTLVKVCILDGKRYAGPLGNFGPGSVIAVPKDEAQGLVKAGAAELVDALPKFDAKPAVERRETADAKGVKSRQRRATKPGEND